MGSALKIFNCSRRVYTGSLLFLGKLRPSARRALRLVINKIEFANRGVSLIIH